MTSARAVVLALAASGCAAGEPCDGKPAVCLSVHVSGAVGAMDRLDVAVTFADGTTAAKSDTNQSPSTFSPPFRLAVQLPRTTSGQIDVALSGSLAGHPVGAGHSAVTIAGIGHQRVDVTLASDALGGDGGANDLAASADLLPTVPIVSVPGFGRVVVGSSVTRMASIENNGAAAVHVTRVSTAAPDVTVAPSCDNVDLQSKGACSFAVTWHPLGSGPLGSTLVADTSAGSFSGPLDGVTVQWQNESLVKGNFTAVSGASTGPDLYEVYAGTDSGALYRATETNGFAIVGATTVGKITALAAVSSPQGVRVFTAVMAQDIVMAFDAGNFNRAVPDSSRYANDTFVAVAALSPTRVWSGSDKGSIVSGDFPTLTAAGPTVDPVVAATGTASAGPWALTYNAAVGSRIVSAGGIILATIDGREGFAIAGVSNTDLWVAGGAPTCPNTSGCAFVYTPDTMRSTVLPPGAAALYGIFMTGPNDVFAVGSGSAIFHYDGVSWSPEAHPVGGDLRAVWSTASGSDVYAVGDNGTIYHRH